MYFCYRKFWLSLCLAFCLPGFSHFCAADVADTKETISASAEDALNQRFLALAQASVIARSKTLQSERFKNLKTLTRKLNSLNHSGNSVDAAAILISNINLVYQNIDDALVPDLTWFLYSNNLKTSADAIVDYAVNNADSFSLAKIQLQRAKYYFIIGDWPGTVNALKDVDVFSALSERDAGYSYLIRGVALQRLRKHREALEYYEKVQKGNEYYSVALLNAALANIRQGWWTDAHILLQQAIDIELKGGSTTFVDRLYLTLGFSLLQNEFYRDARENFRSVGIESPWVNRAMLGIAIAAMHQEDFIGALNMLNALKEKQGIDTSIHEAWLLAPFVYEEIDQLKLAAANYNQAENYFKQLSADLHQQQLSINNDYVSRMVRGAAPSLLEFSTETQSAELALDPLTRLNLQVLNALILQETDKLRRANMEKLQQDYTNTAIVSLKAQFEEQRLVVDSYLSQVRFALANLYDK